MTSLSRKNLPTTEWIRVNRIRFGIVLLLLLLLNACGAGMHPAAEPRGTLRFHCTEPDAILTINDVRMGPAGMFETSGVLLLPGTHRILIDKPGFFTEYRLLEVEADTLQVVSIELRAIPD